MKPMFSGHKDSFSEADLVIAACRVLEDADAVTADRFGGATTSAAPRKPCTVADLERMVEVLRNMPPEPIGEWMRSQGRPPEHWRVVLPQALRDEVQGPVFWPCYVMFSPLLKEPIFTPRGMVFDSPNPKPFSQV